MIPITRPDIGEPEAAAARQVLLSGWTTQGPEVAAFEKEFAAFVGATHACAVSSCTTALHLALLAVGVGPGDEVITVSHTFIATANAVRYCGAEPVFVDIEPDTFNIDPRRVEEAITGRTKAILCVHQMGMPCDIEAIVDIGRRAGLRVIEDAACAAGSEIRTADGWERIGKPHGDVACFSFHPRKLISTGDGGMVTTRDPEIDAKLRLLRQHGMSVPDTVRHSSNRVIFESYPILGYNYRLTDIQAAVGRKQLERLPDIVAARRRLADGYSERLGTLPGVRPPAERDGVRTNWQGYCVRLPDRCGQRDVMQSMLDDGIATRRGIMCCHREEPYGGPQRHPLRESELAQDTCIVLPLFTKLTAEEQDRVVDSLARACGV